MNFFEQQDQARRQTRTLIILFVLAVIAIVVAVNLVAALLWSLGNPGAHAQQYPGGFFLANTLITIGLIGGGTLIETYNLRDGGEAVAQLAGGRPVSPATMDLQERRLLNVVEEMAIASGIACPKVYLLDCEESINAFAAGYNPNEAVVAVTRGTLRRLTRDELQGVVGHEFSHILNGDMRLNVRLIGVLFGIQMIASFGQHLLDFASRMGSSRSRDDKGVSPQVIMLVLGVALFVVGYIGIFFGRLIKSAVSRQREFLADASAIQFTRNPDGIGNALRKIGGLSRQHAEVARIQHPNAEHLSHLFLSAVKPALLSGMFATHPPIAERLRRIFGRSADLLDAPELPDEAVSAEQLPDIDFVAPGFAGAAPVVQNTTPAGPGGTPVASSRLPAAPSVMPLIAGADAPPGPSSMPGMAASGSIVWHTRLSPELNGALHEPQAACAVVYALLYQRDLPDNPQAAVLQAQAPQQAAFVTYLADAIAKLPPGARLPLLDLAMPALRQLPQAGRDQLLQIVALLIGADQRVTLAEFVLETVLTRRLAAHAGRAVPCKYSDLTQLKQECALMLSLVAHVSVLVARRTHGQTETAAQAFMRGAAVCPELALGAADLRAAADIGFAGVRGALEHANQLAPLAKPGFIKALVAAAVGKGSVCLPMEMADLLRAVCAALEAPLPPAVNAAYRDCELAHEQ